MYYFDLFLNLYMFSVLVVTCLHFCSQQTRLHNATCMHSAVCAVAGVCVCHMPVLYQTAERIVLIFGTEGTIGVSYIVL